MTYRTRTLHAFIDEPFIWRIFFQLKEEDCDDYAYLNKKKTKRTKHNITTNIITPSTNQIPLLDITLSSSLNKIVSYGQRIDDIFQQIQPVRSTQFHTPPNVFNLHNMRTNLFSNSSTVATRIGIENLNPYVLFPRDKPTMFQPFGKTRL